MTIIITLTIIINNNNDDDYDVDCRGLETWILLDMGGFKFLIIERRSLIWLGIKFYSLKYSPNTMEWTWNMMFQVFNFFFTHQIPIKGLFDEKN